MECSNQSNEQNGAAIKKEKDARKSPSKEKVKADTKEWKFMIKQLRSELMQLKQKTRKLGSLICEDLANEVLEA